MFINSYFNKRVKLVSILFIILMLCQQLFAQKKTIVKEYNKIFTTYPYSDPNPIPQKDIIYPYFRYDLFTNHSIKKSWKVIELENAYIKILIMPEIGGKIWTAIEKSTGKPFIYKNDVVKFRDVAMRGPWTSGGIEANYGIIGHTPNCATPVDYTIQHKQDGSVSCFIGVLDLLTRTSWQIEINLPKDKAYFTTSSLWYNANDFEQPYYNWMNAAIKAKNDLQFIFPGNTYLGHEGQYHSWPINKKNEKHIDWYKENDFGSYKSYHVFGALTNFFGAYWHDDELGMGRYSTRDDKLGKKIWMWGLSKQGMIWEKLLTDSGGQYAEVQSGRLFNQAEEKSSFTPFKHKGFEPHTTDVWTEYWFPALHTKGMVMANNIGVLNVIKHNHTIDVYFSPLQKISDTLKIKSGKNTLFQKQFSLSPLQLFKQNIPINDSISNYTIVIGDNLLIYYTDTQQFKLNRPLQTPQNYDWTSVNGLYTLGHENMVERNYASALQYIQMAIQKDSNYLPALVDAAIIHYRNGDYDSSLLFTTRALSLNTYNPSANYYYGLANQQLGRTADAIDGFEVAALDVTYRSAAYTSLAKIYCSEQQWHKAIYYAQQSLIVNQNNIDAYQILAIIGRHINNTSLQKKAIHKLQTYNPLNHIVAFENYLANPNKQNKQEFLRKMTNEFPTQTFLEMAIWYRNIGFIQEAIQLLRMAPKNTEVLIWLAYLTHQPLNKNLIPDLIFPFRNETNRILKQLMQEQKFWLLNYYSALIERNNNHSALALNLLLNYDNNIEFAPYFAVRASLYAEKDSVKIYKDLQRAYQLEPKQWRYAQSLVQYFLLHHQFNEALALAKKTFQNDTTNYLMGIVYANTLMENAQYDEVLNVLNSIEILPYEGSTIGRNLYRKALLMLAIQNMTKKNYQQALKYIQRSTIWPTNLGVGKPYDNMLDESVENWLSYQNYLALHIDTAAYKILLQLIQNSESQLKIADGYISPFRFYVTLCAFHQLNNKDALNHFVQQCIQTFPANARLYEVINNGFNNQNNLFNTVFNNDVNIEIWQSWRQITLNK
ncbi:DUF5107 domain-containing protein [Hydrotalea sp.]|uniref:DUF5107 domain-containing protein n=1 Tax=Hydrotalea sp. TaxID=2881279 RepID=UPI003D14E28C